MKTQIEVDGSDTAAPLNLRKRTDLIAKWVVLEGARVLDAGCGAGHYVAAMSERGANAEGIEFLEDKVAQWEAERPGDPRVRRGDIAQLDVPDQQFDAVLLNEVLEHVPDDARALKELYRVLKPGGKLLLFSPNRFHPFETHGVYTRRGNRHLGVGKTFLLPYIPISIGEFFVRYWSRNYWPAELAGMVRRAGFEVVWHGYVWQTFENISGGKVGWIGKVAPLARRVAAVAERIPAVRRLGVSQLIVARRSS